MTERTAPKPYFVFNKNENNPTEIFMSFGLLNSLSKYFETVDQVEEIFLNPELQATILIECLSDRDKKGRITEELNLNELEDLQSVNKFLAWVGDHLTDFFIQMLKASTNRLKRISQTTTP